jgi:YD repeat-containing protein
MGITNALYEPQIRTNLVHGDWDFLNTVIGTGGEMIYPVSSTNLPSAFFRVLFPQPVVTAGEPARYAHGTGGSYLYITGQYFYSGDQVRVGGILANNAVLLSPTLMRVDLPPGLPPGRHDVEILSNSIGAVLATLHEAVTVVDPLTDPDRLLYGPPDAQPASPSAAGLSRKGYQAYQARSDLSEAGIGSSGQDGVDIGPLRRLSVSNLGSSGQDGVDIGPLRRLSVSNLGSSGQDGVDIGPLRRLSVSNLGSSGQDGVDIGPLRRLSVSNLGSSGQDGVDIGPLRRLSVSNIGSSGQDGVSLFSGDVQQQVVDLAIEGRGLDFVWARTYHSRIGRTGSSTNGWTFSYDVSIQLIGEDVLIRNGTGRADRYIAQTNGVYTCPEFFCEGTLVANVFRLTFADTGYWEFRSLTATTAPGKLDRIVDRNGNTVSMSYDTAGRLSEIVDTLGRACTISYDTVGRLVSVTDSFGRTVRYEYDVQGDLVACISPAVLDTPTNNDFPNGKTNRYTYTSGSLSEAENHLLTSCVDALGQTTAQFNYDRSVTSSSYLRCTSFQRGDHPPTMLTYQPQTPTTNNQFATLRCIVNDPEGNVNVILYDCRNRGIEKEQIKRRAIPGQPVTDTSTSSLPIGKLRQDDPDSTVTRWSWNNDSLCTSERAPGGQEVRCTYQGDLDPSTPARKRADCRVVREIASSAVDLDGDGSPDTSERVWQYTYDPRFGADPSRKGWDGSVKGKRFGFGGETSPEGPLGSSLRKGWDGSVKGKIADYRDDDCDDDGFATSARDPRGISSIKVYDSRGNCTASIKQGHYAVSNFHIEINGSYNSFGQLTSFTNAPDATGYRRVDTLNYYANGPHTGYLQSIAIDEPGVHLTTAFEYDTRGNVTRCVDPQNNDWLYTYNSLDQCVRAQSPVNLTARCSTGFIYDANDNLVRCITQVRDEDDTQLGTKTDRASYDALRRITEVALAVDATHALTNRFVYDGNGQCVQILGGDAVSDVDPHHTVSFQYDTCGLLYREVAAPGSALQCTTQYDYDVNGLVTRISEGLEEETPSITTLAYDGFSREAEYEKWEGVLSVMGAKAKAWMVNNFAALSGSENWDGRTSVPRKLVVLVGGPDRPSQIIDPMGNVTTFHHDANDNLITARQYGQLIDVPGSDGNIRLAESRYEYDGLDRCTVQRDLHFSLAAPPSPVGDGECTTTFAYAPNGACIGITNDLGDATSVAYDTAGRVYSVTVPNSKSLRTCLRDAAGNVISVTQTDTAALDGPPQSFTRTFAYDSQNRCVSSTDGAGNTSACAYDSLGRIVRSTDAAGTLTFHHYDLLGRCTATVGDLDGDGLEDLDSDITQQSSWSPSNGRLLSTTDSHGNTTSYEYDSRGRCIAVACADGTQQQFVWSPRSNLIQTVDPKGTISVCTYDPNGRLTRRDITTQEAGGGGAGGALYLETFTFDGCDRLVAHHDDDCDGTADFDSLGNCVSESLNGLVTASTYDALGNRLSLAYPGGRVLNYAYDASGSCTNIAESSASLASFVYDGVDRLARVTYGNGLHSTFEYDGLDGVQNDPGDHGFGQVSHVVHASTNGTKVKISHLSWDLKQNKAARIMPPTGTDGSTNVLTLDYDRADRLVHSTVTEGTTTLRDTTYRLDRMGNRTNVTGATSFSGDYTLSDTIPPDDFAMNQYTTTPGDSREYDANGNLVSRSSLADGALTVYTYDYADRLVSVSTSGFTVASYTYDALGRRASKTSYNNDPPQPTSRILRMVHDRDRVIEEREDNTVLASYTLMHGDGSIIRLSRSGAHYFVLSDDQGNAVALTDESGAVVEGYDYDDYGAVTFLDSDGTPTSATSSAFDNPYCWGGLRLDSETGLHNDDGGEYFEPQVARPGRRAKKRGLLPDPKFSSLSSNSPWSGDPDPSVAAKHYITIPHDRRVPGGSNGNNPWSGGTPLGMKTGTVKFFNDAKGF